MAKEPRDCECGCGEKTKGGRFRPGHDSRMHSKAHASKKIATRMTAPILPTGRLEVPISRGKMAGMKVRGNTKVEKNPVQTGIVFGDTPWQWLAIVNEEGQQWVLQKEGLEILESTPRAALSTVTPPQHAQLARLWS